MTKFCIFSALIDNDTLNNTQTCVSVLVTPVKKTVQVAIISLIFQPNAHVKGKGKGFP
jgi:hypothetical protein